MFLSGCFGRFVLSFSASLDDMYAFILKCLCESLYNHQLVSESNKNSIDRCRKDRRDRRKKVKKSFLRKPVREARKRATSLDQSEG